MPCSGKKYVCRDSIVVVSAVVIRVSIEWPPADEITQIYGHAANSFVLADYACGLMENVINRVDPARANIARNLNATMGTVTSPRVMSRLISAGASRDEARNIVRGDAISAANSGTTYSDVLLADRRVTARLSRNEILELSDPSTYLGMSRKIIDRTVSSYKGRTHRGKPGSR